jgi:hypothetical protein
MACAKAKNGTASSYDAFTQNVLYNCYQGAGSNAHLMLTPSRWNPVNTYMDPSVYGLKVNTYTMYTTADPGDLFFYTSSKYPGKTLVAIDVSGGQVIRLDDSLSKVTDSSWDFFKDGNSGG